MALAVGVFLSAGLIASADSFQECEHNRKQHQGFAALHEDVGLLAHDIVRLRLDGACARFSVGENDGSIVALATIILAIFTWRLWVSTEKLWRSAEAERAANESVRKADAERLDASLKANQLSAETAHKTLLHIERPHIFVSIAPHLIAREEEGHDYAYVAVTVANYGRCPADIFHSVAGVCQEGAEPQSGLFTDSFIQILGSDKISDVTEVGFAAGQKLKFTYDDETGSPVRVVPISDPTYITYFDIKLTYLGIGAEVYESDFTWKWDYAVDRWIRHYSRRK